MARITENTVALEQRFMGVIRSSGVVDFDVTKIGSVKDTFTRDDIFHTVMSDGFRPPAAYNASFSSIGSGFVDCAGTQYLNAGAKLVDWVLLGSLTEAQTKINPPTRANLVSLVSANDIARATTAMLNRVGNQKWNAVTAIAEMQESINMIASTANTLQKAMFCLVRKDWRGLAKALALKPSQVRKHKGDVADGWLAHQLGWSPLVSDMAMAMLYLSGELDEIVPPIIRSAIQLREVRKTVSSVGFLLSQASSVSVSASCQDTREDVDEWRASVFYEVAVPNLRELARYGSFGLSTAWETLPYTFIADWVGPVGDILSAMEATIGLTYKGGSYTRYKEARITRKPVTAVSTGGAKDTIARSNLFYTPARQMQMKRTVWGSSPSPVQVYVKNPLSTWKAITSLALLQQHSSKSTQL